MFWNTGSEGILTILEFYSGSIRADYFKGSELPLINSPLFGLGLRVSWFRV